MVGKKMGKDQAEKCVAERWGVGIGLTQETRGETGRLGDLETGRRGDDSEFEEDYEALTQRANNLPLIFYRSSLWTRRYRVGLRRRRSSDRPTNREGSERIDGVDSI
jgi:hypothetical protein